MKESAYAECCSRTSVRRDDRNDSYRAILSDLVSLIAHLRATIKRTT
jgi:hypothetical protein